MKENFFKNIKENLKNAFTVTDEDDYYDDEYLDEEEEPIEEPVQAPAPKQPRAARPESANAPSYQPYGAGQYQASAYQPYGASGSQADSGAAKSKKSAGNIYSMNDMKPSQKLKVALFVLEDMNDSRNVADCMIDRGIVTICDLSKLENKEERRALDFLDGVKYVCNSKIESISDHIYLVVPEAAELSGDFFSQVDPTPFFG